MLRVKDEGHPVLSFSIPSLHASPAYFPRVIPAIFFFFFFTCDVNIKQSQGRHESLKCCQSCRALESVFERICGGGGACQEAVWRIFSDKVCKDVAENIFDHSVRFACNRTNSTYNHKKVLKVKWPSALIRILIVIRASCCKDEDFIARSIYLIHLSESLIRKTRLDQCGGVEPHIISYPPHPHWGAGSQASAKHKSLFDLRNSPSYEPPLLMKCPSMECLHYYTADRDWCFSKPSAHAIILNLNGFNCSTWSVAGGSRF